jgi:iron complex outermembrane recepter protein
MIKRRWLAISVFAVGSTSAGAVLAQEEASMALEEVLVTARKRLESLQDIPVSATAFNSGTIEARDLRSLDDLAGSTTGLVYENYSTSGLSAAPIIRGMSQAFTTAREQNTSVFLDGVYLQRQSMLNPGLIEMERVEVLKGPQSALYGRNAFAGAINYITKKPTEEFSGHAAGTYGSGDREDYAVSLSGPLIKDKLLGRISYSASQFDGHTGNDHPFADISLSGEHTQGDLGGWDDEMVSVSLSFKPVDSLVVDIGYFNSESDKEPQPFYNLDGARQTDGSNPENTLNCLDTTTTVKTGPFPVEVSGNHAYCGEFSTKPPRREDLAAAGHNGDILLDPRSFAVTTDTEVWTAHLEWEINNNLSLEYLYGYTEHDGGGTGVQSDHKSLTGEGVMTGVAGYDPATASFIFEYTDSTIFNSNPEETLEASSHELRIDWHGEGSLQARGGLYYSTVEDSSWNVFRFIAPCDTAGNCSDNVLSAAPVLPDNLPPGIGHGLQSNLKAYEDDVYAVFGELTWEANDKLTFGLEARYTLEEKSFEQFTTSFGLVREQKDDDDFTYFTPRLTADYFLDDNSLLYASLAKGVKTGGFNTIDPDINPQQSVYDEEENWSLELGSKNTLMGGRLMLNAAAYYIRWTDQQGTESANDPNPWASDVIGNIGDVDILGLELDTVYQISTNWSVDAGYTYNDATFDEAIYEPSVADTNSSFGCDDTICRADGDVSGNVLQRTSKEQAQIGINYRNEFGGWALDARIDANYRSKMYATPLNLAHNGDRTLANLYVGLSRDNWSFSLWGKNITDEKYVANSFVLPSFSGYLVALGPRDTWGLSARYEF